MKTKSFFGGVKKLQVATENSTRVKGGNTMLIRSPRVQLVRLSKTKVGRPRKYTLEFLQTVPDLMIRDGKSLEQIAASAGGKPSTIIELCYRNKIALPSKRKARIFARLKFSTIKRMQHQAAERGLTYNELAEKLLETIAQDNMFKAILDD